MSAEIRWAELLEAHAYGVWKGMPGGITVCRCGELAKHISGTTKDQHRAHLAEVIAAAVAEEQAKAWDELTKRIREDLDDYVPTLRIQLACDRQADCGCTFCDLFEDLNATLAPAHNPYHSGGAS